ncbi:hypothetical protein KKF81_06260 [Candidatus Micrarchaeota archaeon]|nr:hypothetical protein [Candidatus Micrarchaeota archaeon]MBU1166533.1 hypothetical protein [Candidatus Micrarchaeota archaeon]MBU1887545.1 hypothetical protein [Candidatus Micrarchaeota archaeon]
MTMNANIELPETHLHNTKHARGKSFNRFRLINSIFSSETSSDVQASVLLKEIQGMQLTVANSRSLTRAVHELSNFGDRKVNPYTLLSLLSPKQFYVMALYSDGLFATYVSEFIAFKEFKHIPVVHPARIATHAISEQIAFHILLFIDLTDKELTSIIKKSKHESVREAATKLLSLGLFTNTENPKHETNK